MNEKRIEVKRITLETRERIPQNIDLTKYVMERIEAANEETIDVFDENAKADAYDALKDLNATVYKNGAVKIIVAYVLELAEYDEDGDFVKSDYDWLDDYYWLDTEYNFGDYDVKKCALVRGKRDRNGEKDRDTEEVVAWTAYEDIGIEVLSGEDYDANDAEERIDNWIEEELYFLPEYEVN